ncbi:MAG: hypothetical protein AAF705_12540 [Bacteroidota bacterium]
MSIKLLTYQEHARQRPIPAGFSLEQETYTKYFAKKHRGKIIQNPCYQIQVTLDGKNHQIDSSYFIGLDWLDPNISAIAIQPKLDSDNQKIDLFQMLEQALQSPIAHTQVDQLLHIDWDAPAIPVAQSSDFLSPFLAVSYLNLLKVIVRKGLLKKHQKVQKNLHAKVKGKILVSQSIRKNLMYQKASYTYCDYPEQGLDSPENGLLKKALVIVVQSLVNRIEKNDQAKLSNTLSYLSTAFKKVSARDLPKDFKPVLNNHFYPEYGMALKMAQMILNYSNVAFHPDSQGKLQLPPYWIDMSKLFELFVLSLLKDRFQEQIQYQIRYRGNELDYLLKTPDYKMVIDAKYKPIYQTGKVKEDMRQLS